MFNLRSVFAFWAILVLFLGWSGRAEAQTTGSVMVTVPATGVRRDHQDYAGKVLPTQINYKDCLNEDVFTFTVNLGTGYSNGYSLQIWAGTSCENAINRTGTASTCWQVNSVVPNSINMTMQATVRTMLSGRTGGRSASEAPEALEALEALMQPVEPVEPVRRAAAAMRWAERLEQTPTPAGHHPATFPRMHRPSAPPPRMPLELSS